MTGFSQVVETIATHFYGRVVQYLDPADAAEWRRLWTLARADLEDAAERGREEARAEIEQLRANIKLMGSLTDALNADRIDTSGWTDDQRAQASLVIAQEFMAPAPGDAA